MPLTLERALAAISAHSHGLADDARGNLSKLSGTVEERVKQLEERFESVQKQVETALTDIEDNVVVNDSLNDNNVAVDSFDDNVEIDDSLNDNNVETGPGDQVEVEVEVDDITL